MAADTQWPRWEVFKQDTPKKPHQAVGSVHAADPEHALLTARSVFARRPSAVSLWVVPEDAILSATREELEARPDAFRPQGAGEPRPYLVFAKSGQRRSMTFVDHVGEATAASPEAALEEALEHFGGEATVAWWVVPEDAVVRSDPDDAPSWFEPARDKTYKQQSAYGFVRPRTGEEPPARTGKERP